MLNCSLYNKRHVQADNLLCIWNNVQVNLSFLGRLRAAKMKVLHVDFSNPFVAIVLQGNSPRTTWLLAEGHIKAAQFATSAPNARIPRHGFELIYDIYVKIRASKYTVSKTIATTKIIFGLQAVVFASLGHMETSLKSGTWNMLSSVKSGKGKPPPKIIKVCTLSSGIGQYFSSPLGLKGTIRIQYSLNPPLLVMN